MTRRLEGCHVLSLRPLGGHAALRRAAAREGASVLALSPWRIVARADDASRAALRHALQAQSVVFTSPSAVTAANALAPLQLRRGQRWLALGDTTARALRRAGGADIIVPARSDSEGMLDLPMLEAIRGQAIGLVTAPAGRDLLARALARRGAEVLRADVYERVAISPSPSAVARLKMLRHRPWLALSSGQALEHVLSVLDAAARRKLLASRVAAASARLAAIARHTGFEHVVEAAGPQPGDLVAAMASVHPRG